MAVPRFMEKATGSHFTRGDLSPNEFEVQAREAEAPRT